MELLSSVQHDALQYYGVDWLIMLTVFAGIFLLGNKRREGFLIGMISALFGLIFSFQIGSIANTIASVVLLGLYLRGYLAWKQVAIKRG